MAPREIGRVECTLFMIEWLLDADMQRRAQVGLNKGEALRIGRQGEIRNPSSTRHDCLGRIFIVAQGYLWSIFVLPAEHKRNHSMPPAKTSINLTKSAELVLERNQYIRNRSARINQILVRYGTLLRAHRNDELLKIAQDPWVSYCVSEWAEVYPVPATPLATLLQIARDEMEETGKAPTEDELEKLLEATSGLSAVEQMVVIEEVEARA